MWVLNVENIRRTKFCELGEVFQLWSTSAQRGYAGANSLQSLLVSYRPHFVSYFASFASTTVRAEAYMRWPCSSRLTLVEAEKALN
jgi:hypothetical protein